MNSRTVTRIGVALGLAYLVRRLFPPAPRLKNQAYAHLSPAQRLDLYVPCGSGPFPVIVHVHGGGWRTGDKADPRALIGITTLIRKGYAVSSINYRLSTEAKFPAQIHDVKASVRWLRAHAAHYNLDADRIGALGESAGGHLYPAAYISYRHILRHIAAKDEADLKDLGLAAARKSPIEQFIARRDEARRKNLGT
jgi:acetyl esterase/lipase